MLAALTRSNGEAGGPPRPDVAVRPGRRWAAEGLPPAAERVPLWVERGTPMPVAPPLKKRPTWKADMTVAPRANVSGSTSVACWLVVFWNGSALILVSVTFAWALPAVASAAVAASDAIKVVRALM